MKTKYLLSTTLIACLTACQANPANLNHKDDIRVQKAGPDFPFGFNDAPKVEPGNTLSVKVEAERTVLSSGGRPLATVEKDGKKSFEVFTDSLYIQFEDAATEKHIDAFLKKFGGTIVRREVIPAPQNSNQAAAETNNFVVRFDLEEVDQLDETLDSLMFDAGGRGNYKFPTRDAARTIHLALYLNKTRKGHALKHAGFDAPVQHNMVTYEENGYQIPNDYNFWYYGDYVPGSRGNRINEHSWSAWNYPGVYGGEGVKVAVLDSQFVGPGESFNPAIYGNYIYGTDGLLYAYNVTRNNYDMGDTITIAHGRKMASHIFSRANDNEGIAGVAPWARPILLRVDTADARIGGTFDQTATAINIARSWGARVICMAYTAEIPSWLAPSYSMYGPIKDAYAAGIVLLSSTGNDGSGGTYYPASYPEVIGVSAHDRYGNVADFGGGKSANTTSADIYAAGKSMIMIDGHVNVNVSVQDGGTSAATAIVAGACALYIKQGKVTNTDSAYNKLRRDAWTGLGRPILDVYYGLGSQ